MFIVRNVFMAKPGHAGKLAKQLKEALPKIGNSNVRVMIDFVTDFNKIILEHEVETLEEFERELEDFKTNEKIKSAMAGYTDLYLTGKREIYKVVD